MKTSIIQATAADTDTIRDIAEKTWWPTYRDILSTEQIRYMLDTIYSREHIYNQLKSGSQTYLLLMEEEGAVGFAAYSPREEDPGIYKLHKLYCLPQTRGRGYGRLLVEAVSKRVAEAGSHLLELNVNRHNQAKNFYEKLGFAVAYEEDIPIGPYWMNDYVMRKEV